MSRSRKRETMRMKPLRSTSLTSWHLFASIVTYRTSPALHRFFGPLPTTVSFRLFFIVVDAVQHSLSLGASSFLEPFSFLFNFCTSSHQMFLSLPETLPNIQWQRTAYTDHQARCEPL